MPPSSSLDADVRKTLSRWTKEGFYVYLRPITSRYIDVRNKHKVYWKVSVELRDVPPGHWDAEGYNLDDCIRELDSKVPRNRAQWREDRPAGWGAPQSVLDKEIARAEASIKEARKKQKTTKSERPRKRPKRRAGNK